MAHIILDIIEIFGTTIGTIGFIRANLPSQPDGGDSAVRIAVGIHDGLSGSDGATPTIWAFNEGQQQIGQTIGSGGTIGAGSFEDITVNKADHWGKQLTYLQIQVDTDGLCIAYTSQRRSDGTQRG